jgi:transposase
LKEIQQIQQLFSLFDQKDLVEFSSVSYPGERLIACRNPLLAKEKSLTRQELLAKTEKELDKIVAATKRRSRGLKGADKIGLRVGKVINSKKVGKFFETTITESSFDYRRKEELIALEAALDGVYIIRTSVKAELLNTVETGRAYKSLAKVEQAFRSYKTIDLKGRPIYHHLAERVKAHVFLCMLAYYVE